MEDLDVSESTLRWYAIRVRSRAEKVVRDHLQRRDIETFLVLVSKLSRWKDRQKRIEWPLFPGYCFARFAVSDKLVVVQADRPEAIPDEEILALKRVVKSGCPYDAHPALKEGMVVEIIRGPLIGVPGTLLRRENRSRIIVAVNLICQGAAVEIEAEEIVPVA